MRTEAGPEGEARAMRTEARPEGEATEARPDGEARAMRTEARPEGEARAMRTEAHPGGEARPMRTEAGPAGEGRAMRTEARPGGEARTSSALASFARLAARACKPRHQTPGSLRLGLLVSLLLSVAAPALAQRPNQAEDESAALVEEGRAALKRG